MLLNADLSGLDLADFQVDNLDEEVIVVGDHTLLPDTANQVITIMVTGVNSVTGLNVRAQIGDGMGVGVEPIFNCADFTGGLWDAHPGTVTGGPVSGAEQFLQASIVFNETGDEVVADGLAVKLVVDTTGLTHGQFDLSLKDTEIGTDTAFILSGGVGLPIDVTNGLITIHSVAAEIAVTGNGNNIMDGDITPGTTDGTDFGSVVQGQSGPTRTFTVSNDGTAMLTLGSVTLPTGYSLIEGLDSSLTVGASDSFTVRLDSGTVGTRSGQITFTNNDSNENPFNFSITGVVNPVFEPGRLQFSSATYSEDEDVPAGYARITVSRTDGSDGAVSVTYSTNDGTATAGQDYTSVSDMLNWSDGDYADKYFDILFSDDALLEDDETINLTLTGPTGGASLGSPGAAILTVIDDDEVIAQSGQLQFSNTIYSEDEDVLAGYARITVSRTDGSDGAVSVTYSTSDGTATAGQDYTFVSNTLNWSDGNYADKYFDVPLTDDTLLEDDETINLALTGPTGGASLGSPGTAILTVIDDDEVIAQSGQLQFSNTIYSEDEDVLAGYARITVSRTDGSDGAVSVTYSTSDGTATAGQDYTFVSNTLNWSDGNYADKYFDVPLTDDTLLEDDETINLALTGPTGGASLGSPGTATLTIIDDEVIQLHSGIPVQFNDADNDRITVILVGPGRGTIAFNDTLPNDIRQIELFDTTIHSALIISTSSGETTLGGITGGSLGQLIGRQVDLVGDIHLSGNLAMLLLDDVSADSTIDINGTSSFRGLTMIVGDIGTGTSIDVEDTITFFLADSFVAGLLEAGSIGQLVIHAGMGADVTTTGDLGVVLASRGSIAGSITAGGQINTLMAAGNITGSVHAGGINTIISTTGGIQSDIFAQGNLNLIITAQDIAGTIRAASISVVITQGILSADITATDSINVIIATDDISGNISADNNINLLLSTAGNFTGHVRAGRDIGAVISGNLMGAIISAGSNIRTVNVRDDISESYILGGYDIGSDCEVNTGNEWLNPDGACIGFIGVGFRGAFDRSHACAGVNPFLNSDPDLWERVGYGEIAVASLGQVLKGVSEFGVYGLFASSHIGPVFRTEVAAINYPDFQIRLPWP